MTTTWTLDGNGNVTAVTDPEGNVTNMTYNKRNYLTLIEDAELYETWLEYDAVGNITKLQRGLDTNGTERYTTSLEYDKIGRVVSKTVDPGEDQGDLNLTTSFEYVDPSGCGSCGSATPGSAKPRKITDAEGKVVYFHYDELDRLVMSVRKVGGDSNEPDPDPNDAVTRYEYDPVGNLTAMVDPEGGRVEFEYDDANRRVLMRAKHMEGQQQKDVVMQLVYDDASNVYQTVLPNGNTIQFAYDSANRLQAVFGVDSLGVIGVFEYDDNGNVTKRQKATGQQIQTWEFEYDEADRLVSIMDPLVETPDDLYTQIGYDDNGNRVSLIDNNGVETRYLYDDLNRLVQVMRDYQESPDPNDPGIDTINTNTFIEYNGAMQVSLQDHANNETTYEYDAALRLLAAYYPDDPNDYSGTVRYEYDDVGNLISRTDQNGVVTSYDYNDLYQMTTRTYSTNPSNPDTFDYDMAGRLLEAINQAATIEFDYDDLGRLISTTQTYASDSESFTTTFSHVVETSNVQGIINYPGSRTVTKTYDPRFRLQSVLDGAGNGVASWTYDLMGRRTNATLGNDVTSVFTYDINDRIARIQHADEWSNDLFDVSHSYDAVGNRLWTQDNLRAGRDELFEYDALNRLRGFQRGTLNANKDAIATSLDHAYLPNEKVFGLDRNGNWGQFDNTIGTSPAVNEYRGANEVNEYVTLQIGAGNPVSLTHDDNGNMTADPTAWNVDDTSNPSGQTYEYDEENLLLEVGRYATPYDLFAEYTYDALGRRIETVDYSTLYDPCGDSATPTVTRHIYAGLQTIEEYVLCDCGASCEEWILAREFLWGDRFPEPLAMIDHTGCGTGTPGCGGGETFGGSVGAGPWVYHYLHDALGSVVALTDEDGAVVEYYAYDPYGETYIEDPTTGARRTASAYGNPFMWTGQRYDAGVKLYHFTFRSYSTRHGRWLQRDPLGYVDGANLYQYVGSMPLFFTDSFGLEPGDGNVADEAFNLSKRLYAPRNSAFKSEFGTLISAGSVAAIGVIKTTAAAYGLMIPDVTDFAVFLGSKGLRVVGGEIVDKFGRMLRKSDLEKYIDEFNTEAAGDWLKNLLADSTFLGKTSNKQRLGKKGWVKLTETTNHSRTGGLEQAMKDLQALADKTGREVIKTKERGGGVVWVVKVVNGGIHVVVREATKNKKTTLEVQEWAGGKGAGGVCKKTKVRYD